MIDELAQQLIQAVTAQTSAFQARWAEEDARRTGDQQSAESEELALLRPALAEAQQRVDRLREDRREARAAVEELQAQLAQVTAERDQLAAQLADLTDPPTTERTE